MAKSHEPKSVDKMTYEEALAELEGIVAKLEGGENPLEEAMQLYERGQALAARCSALLDAAGLKVSQLSGDTLTPFEEEG